MSDAFKDVSTVPTLTLEPFQAEEEKKPAVQPEEPKLDDTILTEEERRMVDAFAQQIDLTNSSMILQYGAGTQKKMADFSESALENVKSKDLGEVGTLLTNVVTELKSFDEEESKGFLGIFKKASNKVESMKAKYSKAEENVNQIVKALDNHQVQLLKDVAILDKMYDLNLTYFKELSMYILAGKKKLEEVRSTQLAELMSKAQVSGLPEDAQAAKDLDSRCERFDKKLHGARAHAQDKAQHQRRQNPEYSFLHRDPSMMKVIWFLLWRNQGDIPLPKFVFPSGLQSPFPPAGRSFG